jgi:1-acylglycerone phosphate reductase
MILINDTVYEAPAIEADDQRVRAMFDANVFGLFTMVSTFTPLLVKAAAGNASPIIVNVASILARIPFPFASAYNASKAAVASYSDTLRLEVSPLGIRVVTVHMGEVSTGLMSSDNIKFGTESIYIDLEEKVKRRSIQHSKASMGPEKFAHEVVSEVLLEKSPNVWKGTNASAVWLLNALGPRNVFDSSLKGAVGLGDSDLIKKVYNQGQRKVSGDWSVWLGADGSGPLPL